MQKSIQMLLPEITHRSYANCFKDQAIPRVVLDRLLEAGRFSPSIKNRQPWRFIAITDIEKKLDMQKVCYGDERCKQGAMIAACVAAADYQVPCGFSANLFDLGMACSQIMLQAEHEKLAAEIITSFMPQHAARILTLPYGLYVTAIILIGQPETEEKLPISQMRFPAQRTSNYNSW